MVFMAEEMGDILSTEQIEGILANLNKEERLKEEQTKEMADLKKEVAGEVVKSFSGYFYELGERPGFMLVFSNPEITNKIENRELSVNDIKDEETEIIYNKNAREIAGLKEKGKMLVWKILKNSLDEFDSDNLYGKCQGGFCAVVGGFNENKGKLYAESLAKSCGEEFVKRAGLSLKGKVSDKGIVDLVA